MATSSMPLRLAALPPGHSTHRQSLELVLEDAAGEQESYAVDVVAEIDHLGARICVRGTATGRARSGCHRCLRRFERPVAATFSLTLDRGAAPDGEDGEDSELVRLSNQAVEYDLGPHVHEAVVLEEPIQLLCDPACRGLCPTCGADWNLGPCGCPPPEDPRWAPLADLRPPT